MDRASFDRLEAFMRACMRDSAHDREHVYRVLYTALDIAAHETNADLDVLIAACLLHDIGRQEQMEAPSLDHAAVGAEKAERLLLKKGFPAEFAGKVADCILLFGLGRLEAFPVDTWMKKAGSFYPQPEEFGPYAGVAQQYIFHYARSTGLSPH